MGVDEKAREGFRSVGVFNLEETAEIDTYYSLLKGLGQLPAIHFATSFGAPLNWLLLSPQNIARSLV